MTNFFKNRGKKAKPANPEPRKLDEINKTYAALCAQAGELEFKIKINTSSLARIYEALENVNAEANARQALDAPKPSEQPSPTEAGKSE